MNEKIYSQGLTSDEVSSLIKEGKTNAVKSKTDKGVVKIITSNLFTYFNAIFCIIGVLLVLAGAYKSLISLVVIIFNVLIGIFQQLKSKRVLDKLALLDVCEYTAIRDAKEVKVKSPELVLGDLIILESGQQIPADAVVIHGDASVNEALITGEEDEVDKIVRKRIKIWKLYCCWKGSCKIN